MIKKIFFIALSTIPLLAADNNKKMKPETLIEATTDAAFGLDYIPDEIVLNIPAQLTNQHRCNLDDVKSLILLSITSKRMHALAYDKTVATQQSDLGLLLTHSPYLQNRINTLDHAQKTALLDTINAIPSDNLKSVACQRLADLKTPLFSKPIHHALINNAIVKSNLSLFQSCYTILNMAQDRHIPGALRLGAVLTKKIRIYEMNANFIMLSAQLSSESSYIQSEILKSNAEQIEKQLLHS